MAHNLGWPQGTTWVYSTGDTGQCHRCEGHHLQKVSYPGVGGIRSRFCASCSGNLADRKQASAGLVPTQRQSLSPLLKKPHLSVFVQESERLELMNAELKTQIEELKQERQQLILMLNRHRPTCIVRTDSVKTPESEGNPLLEQLEKK